jgi:hypothetical protein
VSKTPENRLGIRCAQNEVDMGPIESILVFQNNTQRIIIYIFYEIGLIMKVFSHIHHPTQPIDVHRIVWLESFEEF